ncbi:MAG: ATP-dependent DNA helicase RecG, partial [Actinomycetota bacterium]
MLQVLLQNPQRLAIALDERAVRGRVGRGAIASRCWLVSENPEIESPRIEALCASTDGFYLAEVDLELRGEGTIMDTAQKGLS